MFWRFGFSSVSTLDTLLDKPNVTLEDVLDEDDLLQECKSQNQKLNNFLRQPRIVKRLMEHVVGTATVGGAGGKDWEEKVKFKYPYVASEVLSCSEVWPIIDAIFSDPHEYLVPFWNAVLTSNPSPSQAPLPMHSHPLFAENAATSSSSANASPSTSPAGHLSVTNFTDFSNSASGSASSSRSPSESESEADGRLRATSALDNGPGRGVLAGYWAKVNGAYLERKPIEMLEFIKEQPRIVERFVAHLETPAVVDLLFRIIQMEETVRTPGQTTDIIDWLSSQDLISRTVDLLAPNYSVDIHNTVSELLKAIIALSAPSPAALNQGQGQELGGGLNESQENTAGINNRLVRELASEPIVRKMVGYMLDSQLPRQLHRRLTDVADEQLSQLSASGLRKPSQKGDSSLSTLTEGAISSSAVEDDEDDESFARPLNPREFPASESRSPGQMDHRGSTATLRPDNLFPAVAAPTVAITAETCSSTLVTCIGVFIELIRKNNSDYFEQHLLRTLHNHLVKRQSELTETRLQKKEEEEAAGSKTEGGPGASTGADKQTDEESVNKAIEALDEEEEDVQGMEEAMSEIVDKMGLVHLGPMLRVLSERLSDFQQLVKEPRERDVTIPTSVGDVAPLTFERYRITELYAELLHCSNMALLNRAPGEGPQYSDDGVLMGGLEGLQTLARTLQGADGPEVGDTSTSAEAETPQEKATEDEQSKSEEATAGNAAEASSSLAPRVSGHGRDKSSAGASTDSTDEADDEALLKEVSLADKTNTEGSSSDSTTDAQAESSSKSSTNESQSVTTSDSVEEDKGDAASIRSALSGLSLAELTAPRLSGPPSPIDEAKDYVVGDMLKRKFLECGILPSLLDLFFDYPWNNFLHNVVYDILQQCFNGRMDVGLNRKLTVAVFDEGHLTSRIVEGRKRNETSVAGPRRIRLGFMGHMNLIAEETVKLLERYPLEIARPVESFTEREEWRQVVSETLEEIREKEGGPLAFNRGHEGMSMSFGSGADDDDDDAGIGGAGSSSFASYLSSQIGGAAGSDDDDSDDEASWLSSEMKRGGDKEGSGFDDAFAPRHSGSGSGELGDDDEDDDWGPFADPSDGGAGGATQSFDFTSGGGSSNANPFAENLTPADWSAQFRKEYHEEERTGGEQDSGSDDDEDEDEDETGTEKDESALSTSPLPGTSTFAPATDVVSKAHARRPSLGQLEAPETTADRRRGSLGSAGPEISDVTDTEDPLGPGIPTEVSRSEEGKLQRTLADGTKVVVPLDEVALGAGELSEKDA
ncbi:SIT4 phosphatase-associated protein family [Kalmanozyma brasiliensis GHG001]|uniref:SAPS-domain-containing protein n=1 Tax=Kalmanozyma brasiliensis (strain GHG001) TaxID=1365824 RepID=V5GG05_KALBG|nr:SIT4 phosphatase-associated protein family [Kalmanozyma brasiliensis GHG001]EST04957.1 SIT4 phosphatase-associated protein family [Kalmanozyma brasiliensis GHG001]